MLVASYCNKSDGQIIVRTYLFNFATGHFWLKESGPWPCWPQRRRWLGEGLPGGDDLAAAEPGAELALLYPEQAADHGQAGVAPHQAGLVALHQAPGVGGVWS